MELFLRENWKWLVTVVGAVVVFFAIDVPDLVNRRSMAREEVARQRAQNILDLVVSRDSLDVETALRILAAAYSEDPEEFLAAVDTILRGSGLIAAGLPAGVDEIVRDFPRLPSLVTSSTVTVAHTDTGWVGASGAPWQTLTDSAKARLDSAYVAGGIDSLLRVLPVELTYPTVWVQPFDTGFGSVGRFQYTSGPFLWNASGAAAFARAQELAARLTRLVNDARPSGR